MLSSFQSVNSLERETDKRKEDADAARAERPYAKTRSLINVGFLGTAPKVHTQDAAENSPKFSSFVKEHNTVLNTKRLQFQS